jgi:hypothetical protein
MNKLILALLSVVLITPRAQALAPEQMNALAAGTVAATVAFGVSSVYRISQDRGIFTPDWKWTWVDTTLQAGVLATMALDLSTTLDIRHHPNNFETNPILGRRPSDAEVTRLMVGEFLAHTAIAVALPKPYRTIWQSFVIGMEAQCIRNNRSIGLNFRFNATF